jgi:phosphoribosyl 1,2-cyclic phosphodiesterase
MVLVIASGSSGNCTFIQVGNSKILVDIGISCIGVEAGLASIGVSPHDVDAVFVTHEHTDHVRGLGVFGKRYHSRIFATHGTLSGIACLDEISRNCDIIELEQSSETVLRGAEVRTFELDHDAAEPFGVTVAKRGFKVSLATDLGRVSPAVMENLEASNVLIFESNYDEKMLTEGDYPWFLKRRIMGVGGHLSNVASSDALLELNWKGLSHVYAAHISRNNNTHRIVLSNFKKAFADEKHKPEIIPAWHDRISQCYRKS